MKKKHILSLVLILLLLTFALALSSCGVSSGEKKPSKNMLEFWIEVLSTKDCASVAEHLECWYFPTFSASQFLSVEEMFEKHYYKDMPDKTVLAKETARIYLDEFYDKVNIKDEEENTTALINAYLAAVGDTYAVYRSAEEYKDYNSNMSGEYVGIGVSVRHDTVNEIIQITEVVPDGPAEEVGLLPGDILHAVDGVSAKELGYNETVARVRGEAGSTVVITVLRGDETLDFTIVRRALTDISVRYSLDTESGIAYVRITQFKSNTASQFTAAIDELEANSLTKGYIFDVRGNPGGYLYTVVDVISYLTKKGSTVVTFTESYSAPMYDTDEHEIDKPLIILTSEYTASAGELFASSLRENKDCEIVGKTTYGKGVMQNTYRFSDGASLTLTISEYNPPSGINYDGVGVVPDYTVENPEDGTDMQLIFATEKLLEKINK